MDPGGFYGQEHFIMYNGIYIYFIFIYLMTFYYLLYFNLFIFLMRTYESIWFFTEMKVFVFVSVFVHIFEKQYNNE